ncbi:MAG: AraC family transcriptional regulator [Oscillospiraceae bacterium]|jgi:AraC-like DNA-binding protein|nr:AraC family transcriptional regulator [Oscillospiraceae bacterium]
MNTSGADNKMTFNLVFLNMTELFPNLNVRAIGWHSRGRGCSFGPGMRNIFVFHYVISGKGVFQSEGASYPLNKDYCFLVRPHTKVMYTSDVLEPWTYAWIDFDGEQAEEIMHMIGFDNGVCALYLPELAEIFFDIKKSVYENTASHLYAFSKFYEVIDRINKKTKDKRRFTSIVENHVERALDFIHVNYVRDITIDDIAHMLNIDRRYFSRIFKQYKGVNPQDYLVNYRLERAAVMLAKNQCAVIEAAFSVGYSDAAAFSKMYKKRFGIPPSKTAKREEP